MAHLKFPAAAGLLISALPLWHCSSSTSASATSPTGPTSPVASASTPVAATPATPAGGSLPAIYSKFSNGTQISLSGSTVVITTQDLPDHKSPYWGAGNAQYEAPQPGMSVNPNRIS